MDVIEFREAALWPSNSNHPRFWRWLSPIMYIEVEIAFRLVELVFPEPGDYRLQLYGAGQFLRERRFLVIPLENPGNS